MLTPNRFMIASFMPTMPIVEKWFVQ